MANEPGVAMDFMGIGKSGCESETQETAQRDPATLVRPIPTFLGFNERTNWQSNLSVSGGLRQNPSAQLSSSMLSQSALATFSCIPAVGFAKGKAWPSSGVKGDVPAGGVPLKQLVFSEKLPSNRTSEELADSDLMQLAREDNQRYPTKRSKQGMMHTWKETQTLQQVLSVKDLFDSKCCEEKVNNCEGGASMKYGPRSLSKNCSAYSLNGTSLTDYQIPNLFGNDGSHIPQPAEDVHGSACPGSHKSLTNSELTLSLASSWSKGPNIPEPGRCSPCLPAPLSSYRGFPMSSSDSDQRNFVKSASSQVSGEGGARISATNSSRPFTAQLTIFYAGQVNIYDDVPVDKARQIMLLAGSGSSGLPSLNPSSGAGPVVPPNSSAAEQSQDLPPPASMTTSSLSSAIQHKVRRPHAELPQARKASLQRFLEKRKERVLARVPMSEKTPETDEPSEPCQALGEKPSSSCKTLETDLCPSVPVLSMQSPADVIKPPHSSDSESSSPSKSQHITGTQDSMEACKIVSEGMRNKQKSEAFEGKADS